MPHKSQKRVHSNGDYSDGNINLRAMKSCFSSETDPSNSENSALNSSVQSEVSDMEEDKENLEEEEEHFDKKSLLEFMTVKLISKDKCLITSKHDSRFYFKGKIQVKVIQGVLEILGSNVVPSSGFTNVYSPRGYSLLSIHARKGEQVEGFVDNLLGEGVLLDDAKSVSGDCVFIVKKLSENWTKYVHKHLNVKTKLNLLFRDQTLPEDLQNETEVEEVEQGLDINLLHPANCANYTRLFETGENWDLVLTSVEISQNNNIVPRVVVAGGKGVGKSTFLRWLTNKMLSKQDEVLLLDLDPGQAELAIPGYLSVSVVTKPLLGPNFCHIDRKTVRSVYLGDINVSNCPGRFLNIAKSLVDLVNKDDRLRTLPLLVNTMGWARGVGLMLLVDTIRYIQPSTVVQLHSRFQRKNLPYSLTPEVVASSRDSWTSARGSQKQTLRYNLIELLAVPESINAKDMRSKDYWGLPDPRITRETVLLSSLGRAGGLNQLKVYKIPLSKIALHVSHTSVEPKALLAAVDLAIVDMLTVDEKEVRKPKQPELYGILRQTPLEPSLGYGIIRNIDAVENFLYLATHVESDVVVKANCLVAGSTRIPDSVLICLKQRDSLYLEPSSTVNPLDAPWQRHHKPKGGP